MPKAARNMEWPRIHSQKLADRWNVAKRLQPCYRCLAQGHQGKSCPQSQPCGQDGCVKLHHRLLHKPEQIEYKSLPLNKSEFKRTGDHDLSKPTTYQDTFLTEGNERTEQTTMVTQSHARAECIALRTVPVILINGDRSLEMNALLDDASTKTYINADVADKLDLQGRIENLTVSVLNGQDETFETRPVNV